MRKTIIYGLAIAGIVIVAHQLAQDYLFALVKHHGDKIEITGFMNIVEVWNKGISFGMFNSLAYGQWLLSALALGISAVLIYCLLKTEKLLNAVALGLILGGAIGNTHSLWRGC